MDHTKINDTGQCTLPNGTWCQKRFYKREFRRRNIRITCHENNDSNSGSETKIAEINSQDFKRDSGAANRIQKSPEAKGPEISPNETTPETWLKNMGHGQNKTNSTTSSNSSFNKQHNNSNRPSNQIFLFWKFGRRRQKFTENKGRPPPSWTRLKFYFMSLLMILTTTVTSSTIYHKNHKGGESFFNSHRTENHLKQTSHGLDHDSNNFELEDILQKKNIKLTRRRRQAGDTENPKTKKIKKIEIVDDFENLTCDEIENEELYQMYMRMQKNACWMVTNEKDRDKIHQARKKALTPSEQDYWDRRIMVSYFDHFDFTTRRDPDRDLIIDLSDPLPDKKEDANFGSQNMVETYLLPAGCDKSNCGSVDERDRSDNSDDFEDLGPEYDYTDYDPNFPIEFNDYAMSDDSFPADDYSYLIYKNVTNENGETEGKSEPNCDPTDEEIDRCIKRVRQPMPVSKRARIQACGIYKNQCRQIKSLWLYAVDSAFTEWLLTTATKDQAGNSHGSVLQSITTIEAELIVNNVKGLKNLGKLLPNLALIQGEESGSMNEMTLAITENPDLEELGLNNLRYILNKRVYIKDNPKLCNLHLINWFSILEFFLKHRKWGTDENNFNKLFHKHIKMDDKCYFISDEKMKENPKEEPEYDSCEEEINPVAATIDDLVNPNPSFEFPVASDRNKGDNVEKIATNPSGNDSDLKTKVSTGKNSEDNVENTKIGESFKDENKKTPSCDKFGPLFSKQKCHKDCKWGSKNGSGLCPKFFTPNWDIEFIEYFKNHILLSKNKAICDTSKYEDLLKSNQDIHKSYCWKPNDKNACQRRPIPKADSGGCSDDEDKNYIKRLNPTENEHAKDFTSAYKGGEKPSTVKQCENEGCRYGCMDVKEHGKTDKTKELCVGCKDNYWFQNNGREQGCFKSCKSNGNDKPLLRPKMDETPGSEFYVNKKLSDAVFKDKEFEYGETIYYTSINSPKKYDTGICMTRDSCEKSEATCKNTVECWPIEPSIAVSESVSHCIFATKNCPEGFYPEDVDPCTVGFV